MAPAHWFSINNALATPLPRSAEDQSLEGFLIWSAILIGAVLIGVFIVSRVRRMIDPREENQAPDGFTLHGLRQLRSSGQITEEEFQRAREALIERVKSSATPDAGPQAEDDRPQDETTDPL